MKQFTGKLFGCLHYSQLASLSIPFVTEERCYIQKLKCRPLAQQAWQWRSTH